MDSRRDFTSKKVFSGYFSELGEKANSALAGCVACVRSLPMRDRARAMRPARYVGPAGKERF